jgi:hypothetical protein
MKIMVAAVIAALLITGTAGAAAIDDVPDAVVQRWQRECAAQGARDPDMRRCADGCRREASCVSEKCGSLARTIVDVCLAEKVLNYSGPKKKR